MNNLTNEKRQLYYGKEAADFAECKCQCSKEYCPIWKELEMLKQELAEVRYNTNHLMNQY